MFRRPQILRGKHQNSPTRLLASHSLSCTVHTHTRPKHYYAQGYLAYRGSVLSVLLCRQRGCSPERRGLWLWGFSCFTAVGRWVAVLLSAGAEACRSDSVRYFLPFTAPLPGRAAGAAVSVVVLGGRLADARTTPSPAASPPHPTVPMQQAHRLTGFRHAAHAGWPRERRRPVSTTTIVSMWLWRDPQHVCVFVLVLVLTTAALPHPAWPEQRTEISPSRTQSTRGPLQHPLLDVLTNGRLER